MAGRGRWIARAHCGSDARGRGLRAWTGDQPKTGPRASCAEAEVVGRRGDVFGKGFLRERAKARLTQELFFFGQKPLWACRF